MLWRRTVPPDRESHPRPDARTRNSGRAAMRCRCGLLPVGFDRGDGRPLSAWHVLPYQTQSEGVTRPVERVSAFTDHALPSAGCRARYVSVHGPTFDGTDPAEERVATWSRGCCVMDWYVAWVKSQQELSEASKADHYWKTLPSDLRSRLPPTIYRTKRTAAACASSARRCRLPRHDESETAGFGALRSRTRSGQ